jgi:uncharacterized protein
MAMRPSGLGIGRVGRMAMRPHDMASVDMSEDLIRDIVRRIVETSHPEKIILFGSRDRGDARTDSDFDVLVITESNEPGYRRDAALYLALAGLNLPVDVLTYTPEEIRDWSAVPQAFVTTALREGKLVYERKS